MKIRIATRRSELARTQAESVARAIEAALGVGTELVPLQTTGDRFKRARLAELGGKGLFIKEIEDALLEKRADVAVHSGKDLPAELPRELTLVAFPERADPRDALVCRRRGMCFAELPRGARVGTGSTRRTAQLRRARPDLEVVFLRGNVATRIRKIETEGLDAVILACAGMDRLGLGERIDERLAPEVLLPAVTQGQLAVQVRAGDSLAQDLAALDHPASARRARAERAFLERLEGDCFVPLAVLAECEDADAGDGTLGALRVRGLVAAPDGTRSVSAETRGADPGRAGTEVAEAVLARGGAEILAALREEPEPR